MQKESWKDVPNFEDFYKVSSIGRVYSKISKKILSQHKDKKGYYQLKIKGKRKTVHRLVALAFIPNLDNKPQVNHKNGIKSDNRVCNLEWVTNSENKKHAYKLGLISAKGSKNCKSKLSEKDIPVIRAMIFNGFPTKQISDKFKVSYTSIYNIRDKKTWSHV